jgi:NAD(P)H-nitrite reductase large subunit
MDLSPLTCHSGTIPNTTSRINSNSSNSNQQIKQNNLECTFLIIGGGIAGVSCAESINFLAPDERIIIITESPLIKSVTNLVQLGKFVQQFQVTEIKAHEFRRENINVITDKLKSIASIIKRVETLGGARIQYKFLCICTGARPKLINSDVGDFVLGIRDTESVSEFQKQIKNGNKFVLVGNGGIASEIAYEINNIEIDWIVKDQHISSTFIDAGAAKFFESRLHNKESPETEKTVVKRMRYMEESSKSIHQKGAALGPDWHRLIDMSGVNKPGSDNIKVHFGVEVKSVSKTQGVDHPIEVELTDGSKILTNFIVSATGVDPFISFECDKNLKMSSDGGICVDELMRTSIESIFAAGDVCFTDWEHSKYWHQMKLWTQARQMGMMAGKSMVAQHRNEEIYQDFCFELFSHVTKLYGYQVVLLGMFNGQGLDDDYEILLRVTPDKEYVKFVLKNGRLVGALLIGETGLEETCENLILNQIDLTPFGDDILNPNIDIEDYFD